jgi:hypothetical protein
MMSRLDKRPSRYHQPIERLRPNMERDNEAVRFGCGSKKTLVERVDDRDD